MGDVCLKERTQWILNKFNRTWLSRMFLEFGPIAVSFSRLMLSFCGKGQDHSVARDKIILWQGTRPTGFRPKILPDGEKNQLVHIHIHTIIRISRKYIFLSHQIYPPIRLKHKSQIHINPFIANVQSEIHLGWRVLPALLTVLAVREDNALVANLRKEYLTKISQFKKRKYHG